MPIVYDEDGGGSPGFTGGAVTTGGNTGDTDTYDPNWNDNNNDTGDTGTGDTGGGDDNITDPNPDDGDQNNDVVITDPDPNPDDGGDDSVGDGPVTDTQEPPDTDPGVNTGDPDADFITDENMDYTVPDAEDVETPTGSGTADVEQTMWDVTDEQTVAGQFEELYDRDSPIFELARQRAIRQHLGSGGQNSAMAAGFGEVAAMDKAFEMAKQDALTYARSAEFNAAMSNQYSLAEQRFIHNALLSDQAFEQAKSLQTQRIKADFEKIVLDYKGRSALMDQELNNWFQQSYAQFKYDMGKLSFQLEGEKQMINMQALANFYTNGFSSVMQVAANPNLTPEQSRRAIEQGMGWFNTQLGAFRDILNANTFQSPANDFIGQNWWMSGNNQGSGSSVPADSNGYPNWGDYSSYTDYVNSTTTYGERVGSYTDAVRNGEMYWQQDST